MPIFYRQMAVMIGAGVSLSEALAALLRQSQPRGFRKCLETLNTSVLQGRSLSSAMGSSSCHFTGFQVAMIVAGERSGDLALALLRLAEHSEEEFAMRSEIKRELFYPKLVMAIVLLIWPSVLFEYRHDFAALLLIGLLPLASFCALLLLGAILPRLSGQPRPWLDYVLVRIPLLGKTVSLIGQTHFARNLSFLYHAGISLPEAVRWSSRASGNAALAEPLHKSAVQLDHGAGIATALHAAGILDPILITMLRTGEATGNLEVVLDKAVEHFQQMTALALHRLKVSLGVAALLNVGFCVGIILFKFYS